jgi:menaquinol-cytochrome c reductase iron-sulfur subunit
MAMLDDSSQKSEREISRRKFFKVISVVFSGFIGLSLGIPLLDSVVGTVKKKANKVYSKLISINSIPTDQPINLPFVMTKEDAFIKNVQPENVWAVKNSDETTIFSPICPHLGCRYQWHEEQKLFVCPCHHSVFDINGKVVSGPAPRSLDTLPSKVKNNFLYVLWERFKPGISSKEII